MREFSLILGIKTDLLESNIIFPPPAGSRTGWRRFNSTGPDDAAAGLEHVTEEGCANPCDIAWI